MNENLLGVATIRLTCVNCLHVFHVWTIQRPALRPCDYTCIACDRVVL